MRKKLEGNGLWESSRMMLHEHKERILEANQRQERREKPILDPQKREEINESLGSAYQNKEEIKLLLWHPYENRSVTGVIAKLDLIGYRILIDDEWVKLAGILEVTRRE
ncbi:YolD-like family protein [Cohnella silvisoli]|uniref:YolD-like family protein n=1 Tax=Cohnella silvisoli TaxID=2873699 RepID=A0ABV1KMF5_9BACL|nr:YolD-like family protein [Cohnella silvisoli]MCD9020417.1 YolD-like family protein [Cohnella silvisoli]